MALWVLLLFGVVSSVVLVVVGVHRAVTRRYHDRSGALMEGAPAIRAGLLVAFIGACELALTWLLWAAAR